jgi:hypothetical protein
MGQRPRASINKAENSSLLRSNIEDGFKAQATADAKIKDHLRAQMDESEAEMEGIKLMEFAFNVMKKTLENGADAIERNVKAPRQ